MMLRLNSVRFVTECVPMRAIAIDCLNCGHCVQLPESDLEALGFQADESLVVVTKKLVCSRCHSKAVRAYRFIDDDMQPVFHGPPLAPKDDD